MVGTIGPSPHQYLAVQRLDYRSTPDGPVAAFQRVNLAFNWLAFLMSLLVSWQTWASKRSSCSCRPGFEIGFDSVQNHYSYSALDRIPRLSGRLRCSAS